MKGKLNRVLLIDDDLPTNFLNEFVIKKANCAQEIVTRPNGQAALDYLLSLPNNEQAPELIFLDLNMPAMNGWEFLDHFKNLTFHDKHPVVVVLTTSMNPDDRMKAEAIANVNAFMNKPLNPQAVESILKNHFCNDQIAS